jgi:N-acetyl-anhydromuramyl-L-alanine amidase AmpD
MKEIDRSIEFGAAHNNPKMIVVHAMAEHVGDAWAPDFLDASGLSAHAMVTPDGNIIRCRMDNEGAYHAKGFNKDSLGVEVLVRGRHDYGSFAAAISKPWCDGDQYSAVVKVVRDWMLLHDIDKVVRHSDLSPGRKIDPGTGFPWDQFLADLKGIE